MQLKIRANLFGIFFMIGLFLGHYCEAKPEVKKHKGTVVNEEKFDFIEYGRIEKNEIEVSLKIFQKDSDVLVALIYENISKRPLHVYPGLWFTHLEVTVNDNSIKYIGPMASMPPPEKSDFKTLQPGDRFSTESVLLNSYYALPRLRGGQCVVKYLFEKFTVPAQARFTLK